MRLRRQPVLPARRPGATAPLREGGVVSDAARARAHFDEWIAFYQDFYKFPADIPVTFGYGFDSYKVTYCTNDAVLPGQNIAETTIATGMVSVPRKSGPLSTVAYLHGTSVSFYDAPSNPNIFGEFRSARRELRGPPSNAVFAGNGFIYIAPDYLGLGDSTVPRHRYFHAATEASSAVDLLAASQKPARRSARAAGRQALRVRLLARRPLGAGPAPRVGRMRVDVDGTATVGGVFDVEQWFLASLASETPSRCRCTSRTSCSPSTTSTTFTTSTADVFRQPYACNVRTSSTCSTSSTTCSAGLPPPRSRHPQAVVLCAARRRTATIRCASACARTPWIGGGREAPVRVYHSPDDEEVPYDVTLVSVERLRRRGATSTCAAPRLRPRQQLDSGDAAGGAMVPARSK